MRRSICIEYDIISADETTVGKIVLKTPALGEDKEYVFRAQPEEDGIYLEIVEGGKTLGEVVFSPPNEIFPDHPDLNLVFELIASALGNIGGATRIKTSTRLLKISEDGS